MVVAALVKCPFWGKEVSFVRIALGCTLFIFMATNDIGRKCKTNIRNTKELPRAFHYGVREVGVRAEVIPGGGKRSKERHPHAKYITFDTWYISDVSCSILPAMPWLSLSPVGKTGPVG